MKYNFITEWVFKASPKKVWEATRNVNTISLWWPGFKKCQARGGVKTLEAGTIIDAAVQGLLGDIKFTLEVTEVLPPVKLTLKSEGDLEGAGEWELIPLNEETITRISWNVSTTGWLMNVAGFLFKPLFMWNHNRVMAAGYQALKEKMKG